jgi:hypothetical protein
MPAQMTETARRQGWKNSIIIIEVSEEQRAILCVDYVYLEFDNLGHLTHGSDYGALSVDKYFDDIVIPVNPQSHPAITIFSESLEPHPRPFWLFRLRRTVLARQRPL